MYRTSSEGKHSKLAGFPAVVSLLTLAWSGQQQQQQLSMPKPAAIPETHRLMMFGDDDYCCVPFRSYRKLPKFMRPLGLTVRAALTVANFKLVYEQLG